MATEADGRTPSGWSVACRTARKAAFAALACRLNDAQGAYRGPTGGPLVFLTYGTVTLSQIPK